MDIWFVVFVKYIIEHNYVKRYSVFSSVFYNLTSKLQEKLSFLFVYLNLNYYNFVAQNSASW